MAAATTCSLRAGSEVRQKGNLATRLAIPLHRCNTPVRATAMLNVARQAVSFSDKYSTAVNNSLRSSTTIKGIFRATCLATAMLHAGIPPRTRKTATEEDRGEDNKGPDWLIKQSIARQVARECCTA